MEIESFNATHPAFHDPRYQRRVIAVTRPIPIVSNMFDIVFECHHSPLIFNDTPPRPGDLLFCPGCFYKDKTTEEKPC